MKIKHFLLLLLLFFGQMLRAQTTEFTQLDWGTLRIDSLLPVYSELIPLDSDPARHTYRVQLEYPEYAPLTAAESRRVQALTDSLPMHPVVELEVGSSQKRPYASLHFIPLVCREGRYYKLVSCKIVLYPTPMASAKGQAASRVKRVSRYADKSVLATGRWVKIGVQTDGVYCLTTSALQKMGFSDPSKVRLYGYGGHLQDEVIDADNDYDDLEQVPLYQGASGLLFYANGLVSWNRTSTSATTPRHRVNHYAREACYFLTESDVPATFPTEESAFGAVRNELTSFTDFVLHEKDEYAWFTGGQKLFEAYDYATGNSRTYKLPTVNPTTDPQANLLVSFSACASTLTRVTPTVNGVAQRAFSVTRRDPESNKYDKAMFATSSYKLSSLPAGSVGTTVRLTTTAGNEARLDFMELSYERQLAVTGSYLPFSHTAKGISRFTITLQPGRPVSVWRVGEPGDPTTEIKGVLKDNKYAVTVDDATRRYVAVDVNGTFAEPTYMGIIANQNLHGTDTVVDMVIVVPASGKLTAQARRLAEAHAAHDGLRVQVVRADQIYNEFSSGTPDATAYRRYLKMLYDRAPSAEEAPRYLLLFGDCAWDNRMLSSAWKAYDPKDFLLCYESSNSHSEVNSYVMEDYFGLLDDGEGSRLTSDKVDLGVGRFPVRTAEEARVMVDKTLAYLEGTNTGLWRNIVCMLGDDGDNNEHMEMADDVAQRIQAQNPGLEVRKVMWDAYRRESSTTGNRYPIVHQKIIEQMDEGALMMNYTGHAIHYSLSAEQVLRLEDFKSFASPRLPLWVTAACDVMPFDTQMDNIGEAAVLNPRGGAVAFYGTARTVYANWNLDINRHFTRYLFGTDDAGRRYRLGDAVRLSKLSQSVTNKLHYALLGDPALVIGAPLNRVVLDSINGQLLADLPADSPIRLQAGSLARFSGRVLGPDGALLPAFDGVLSARVFDSEDKVVCLNNDQKAAKPFTYESWDKVLFHGNDSVRGGEFSFTFPVPVDISYTNESGRVVFYAVSDDRRQEANGYNEDFLVGGSSGELSGDKEGPKMTAYLNHPDFQNGEVVNATPYFVASLEDESGINTTHTGVGHNLELSIDGNPATTYDLNDYYLNEFGDYRRGSVAYSIPRLPAGEHTLTFRAWDMLNNTSSVRLSFVVDPSRSPRFSTLTVTENPAREHTTFLFHYDRPGSVCTFTIEVFDFSGRLLWTHTETGSSTTQTYAVPWNLTTGGGVPLQTGVYLYRATLSCDGSEEATQAQKIIISRNK